MLRGLIILTLIVGLCGPTFAADPPRIAPRPLASAFDAMQAGRWDVAERLAARDGPAAQVLIEWHRLHAGLGTASEVIDFLAQHPDWPGLAPLRRQLERSMTSARAPDVLAFFETHQPQTGTGVLAHARALAETGQIGEAEASLVIAWRTLDLTTAEHEAFMAAHADLLEPHHIARFDMAVWRGLRDVEQMAPLVPKEARKRAETRALIESNGKGLDERLEELTFADQLDPGIAYALFNRHIKKGKEDAAIALILTQSGVEGGLGEAARWSGWRRALARAQMRGGHPELGYALASNHHLADGSAYADLEWLSGYLALTYLDAPELALDHFQRFRVAVASPISLGRAGYWLGRAQEALGDNEAAQDSYAFGARYQTSFYGLLAAERAELPPDPALSGQVPADAPPWQSAEFAQSTVFDAAILALATGRITQAERFFVHLSQGLEGQELTDLGRAVASLNMPHLEVMLGKAAARRGIVLSAPYYALHPLHELELAVPAELALAIARRESEFDPAVISGANAQGLMQLLPGTAKDVARDLELDYDRNRLLGDWQYNATLGSAYLAQMAARFEGNIIMTAAAYNAGPARPPRWMKTYGDPRRSEVDMIDWIEHIPFRETRNYVMRVSESLPVYRARLGKDPHPVPFSQELSGSSLLAPLD